MKRKWMWMLAVVSLFAGFVVAKRLADKRPRLVVRDVDASQLIFASDGTKMVARGNASAWSHIVDLSDGSQFSVPGDVNSRNFFAPDGAKLYQLNTEWENPNGGKFHDVLVVRDAHTGRTEGEFRFASGANLYGAWWHNNEIIVESPRQTWHFRARDLRLVGTQKQRRTQAYAILCPDGRTLYWLQTTDAMGATPDVWKFADLNSGKILWSDSKFGSSMREFSVDGHTSLWSDNAEEQIEVVARDTRTGAEKWRLRGPQSSVVALSPDQSAVYEARPNGELWKWPR